MRRLAFVLLFALPLFGYEIRSSRYLLAIELASDRYNVSVTDLEANVVISFHPLSRSEEPVSVAVDASGGRKLHLLVHERKGQLDADLRVERGTEVLDVLHGTWLAEPAAAPAERPTPLRVGGDVRAPLIARKVEPLWTEEAKAARIAGIVIIEAIIDRNGKVVEAKVLKPLPFGLDRTAVEAVRQWEFEPATLNGKPVDVIFNLVVNFLAE